VLSGQPVWYAQARAKFFLAGVSSEKTKFFHVISQMDHRYAAEVENIITSPPKRDPYTMLRTKLVTRLSPSTEQRICQLLTLKEMSDGKPTQFLRQLRGFASDMPEDFLYTRQVQPANPQHTGHSRLSAHHQWHMSAL
jgi:hypothetical protein